MTRSLPLGTLPCLGLLAALVLAGCASMDLTLVAPPPPAQEGGGELLRGRQIYVTRCAKCHAPEPVKKYSPAEWQTIMPEMAEETNLSSADSAAVMAYVQWALKH